MGEMHTCRVRLRGHRGMAGPRRGGVVTVDRKRPIVQITLSPEARERLDELARRTGRTRSAMVEDLVRDAAMPRER